MGRDIGGGGRGAPCVFYTINRDVTILVKVNIAFLILVNLDPFTGDAKPSEVMAFISEYLEKALDSSGWKAVWRTDIFEVLVEVYNRLRVFTP